MKFSIPQEGLHSLLQAVTSAAQNQADTMAVLRNALLEASRGLSYGHLHQSRTHAGSTGATHRYSKRRRDNGPGQIAAGNKRITDGWKHY